MRAHGKKNSRKQPRKKPRKNTHSIFHSMPLAPVAFTSTTSPVNTPCENSFAIRFPTSALLPRSFPESSAALFFFFLRGGGVTGVDAPELLLDDDGDADRFLSRPPLPAGRFGEAAAAAAEREGLFLDLLAFGADLAPSFLGRPLPRLEGVVCGGAGKAKKCRSVCGGGG